MKIAICFLSKEENHFNYNLLKEQCNNSKNHKIDIFYYINKDIYNYKKTKDYIYFNYNYLQYKFNYNHIFLNKSSKFCSYVGLTFLPWLDMYFNNKDKYDFYLFYEDDICYYGEQNLFDLIDFNCDVILQDKNNLFKNDKEWFWYKEFDYNILNSYDIYHSLMNIYGATKRVIDNFIIFIKKNYIHHEGLIPTFVLNNNYNINYINNYISIYCNYINDINFIKSQDYNLIHPIKTNDEYMRIKILR